MNKDTSEKGSCKRVTLLRSGPIGTSHILDAP